MRPQRMNRQYLILAIIPFIVILFIYLMPHLLYRGANPITLQKSDQLVGRISQALAVSGSSSSVPQPTVDYTVSETTYFLNKEWVVVKLMPVGNSSINGLFVLQKSGDEYDVKLGPGSSFSSSMISSLPADIQQKLNNEGYVYGN